MIKTFVFTVCLLLLGVTFTTTSSSAAQLTFISKHPISFEITVNMMQFDVHKNIVFNSYPSIFHGGIVLRLTPIGNETYSIFNVNSIVFSGNYQNSPMLLSFDTLSAIINDLLGDSTQSVEISGHSQEAEIEGYGRAGIVFVHIQATLHKDTNNNIISIGMTGRVFGMVNHAYSWRGVFNSVLIPMTCPPETGPGDELE